MFRSTAVRGLLAALAAVLLALQLRAGTENFASAHTFGQTLLKAETGIVPSAWSARAGADTVRAPGSPDAPVGTPHLRDRHRGPAAGWPEESTLDSGRGAGEAPSAPPDGTRHSSPRAIRAHTPAALQVFRC
ncbi:hypothetical protein [Streptomyces lavenduligriseus]|uniref:Secreted protein n=1 Tax=Streptomyces lavenduligriseus TaxID=67315 RepID=A0ABT0NM42_9ACTN|nr:hypothetical protein [Streptomyces lavenduligriseus]MCL3992251.1 hypothetical protein [Streptomyces lavenduligriseus]